MRLLASLSFATTLTVMTAAAAQPSNMSPGLDDARCLLATLALSNSFDPNQQRVGRSGVIYFTGRIAERDPNFDFTSLKSLGATMDVEAVETDLQQRCGPMFNKSMQQLGSVFALPDPSSPPPASPDLSPPSQP